MISGADVRRYRKTIGMGQVTFAQRLGISQSTLSVLEGGRIAVSEEHLARLRESFDEPGFKPRFSEFVRELESQAALGQAALAGSEGRFLTLIVYAWEEGFDLSRPPTRGAAAGLVTIRATEHPAIAFEMNRRTEAWEKGEILVFERCEPNGVADGDLILVQISKPRARGPQTMIATVRVGRTTHGRTYGFEPATDAWATPRYFLCASISGWLTGWPHRTVTWARPSTFRTKAAGLSASSGSSGSPCLPACCGLRRDKQPHRRCISN